MSESAKKSNKKKGTTAAVSFDASSSEKASPTSDDSNTGKYSPDSLVIKELKRLYKTSLLPIEKKYIFNKFHHPEILDSELNAKPMVLLVGQYSTG